MKLSDEDVVLFYRLYWSLLYCANRKYQVIKGLTEPDFTDRYIEDISALQHKVDSEPEIIDSFINENPFEFNEEELSIVKSWKSCLTGEFFVAKYLKAHTVFLSQAEEPKAYGVLGLYDEIEDILDPDLPVMVNTTLLPFKGKIIYSGILRSSNILFGAGIKRSINAEYQMAKSRFGIIQSLEGQISGIKDSDEDMMKFYVKNESNIARYSDEIYRLLTENPSFWKTYYQAIGRNNARRYRKRFSEIGIQPAWFAIYDEVILASGRSEQDLNSRLDGILSPEKRDHVHIFEYTKKKNKSKVDE